MEQKKIEQGFLANMSLMMEHMAMLASAMTQIIKKYEILIEDTASFKMTLARIEDKIDLMTKTEEEEVN